MEKITRGEKVEIESKAWYSKWRSQRLFFSCEPNVRKVIIFNNVHWDSKGFSHFADKGEVVRKYSRSLAFETVKLGFLFEETI